jgi:hypothetical protein
VGRTRAARHLGVCAAFTRVATTRAAALHPTAICPGGGVVGRTRYRPKRVAILLSQGLNQLRQRFEVVLVDNFDDAHENPSICAIDGRMRGLRSEKGALLKV